MIPKKSNFLRLFFLSQIFLLSAIGCRKNDLSNVDFRQEMRQFVVEISEYSKSQKPDFVIIPQNGTPIISRKNEELVAAEQYINAIDAIGQESLFFGYDADNKPTPKSETDEILSFFYLAKNVKSIPIFVTDYCSSTENIDLSFQKNDAQNFVSFAADDRNLRTIPNYPTSPRNENAEDIQNISDAKNFLYLINPEYFKNKEEFISALEATNFDIILIDLFFADNQELSSQDVNRLKIKQNGATRKVICYMSIGEAEDYRYYWQVDWKRHKPKWLEKENRKWSGNYKVRYWDADWKKIIYSGENSYLNKIICADFDGVYLDIIDGFEYFEEKYN